MERPHSRRRGRLLVVPVIAVAVAAAACGINGERGSGNVKREPRQLASFTEIDVGSVVDVDVTVGGAQSVEVSGDDNLVPLVSTEIKAGRLVIRTTKKVDPKLDLVVHIVVPNLTGLWMTGASHAVLRGVRGDKLTLNVSGAGSVSASGSIREVDIDISGAGKIDAKELKAETARIALSGAGSLSVYASKTLDVHVSGAGKVSYYGDPPEVRKDISGAGSFEKK